jgi:hypothetical protein
MIRGTFSPWLPLRVLWAPLGIDLLGCLVVPAVFLIRDIVVARFRHP